MKRADRIQRFSFGVLSADGQAKISDFGIARRAPTGEEGDDTIQSSLTHQGVILGTCRAMSPEQVCGDPLDERSDLFAFGILLYETFTGHSPFLAGTNRETLQRILHHSPPSAIERVPALPEALSDLIDRLLAISALASLELTYGDPRCTVEILAPRLAREPSTWQLTSLSLAHMLLRDYAASARASEQALALKPENPAYLLNLADARWLDGRLDEALALYRRVLQRALRLAPEDAETGFNAALVYTVVGDWTTAEVNARRVLALGYARRWFELSWFDELRSRPTFVQLVSHRRDSGPAGLPAPATTSRRRSPRRRRAIRSFGVPA